MANTWLLAERGDATRTVIAAFILVMWTLQLMWSKPWLERFRFGPAEWAWRCATYGTLQPFRIQPNKPASTTPGGQRADP